LGSHAHDISETGVKQARRNAGPFASHIHFAVNDLTRFKASQTKFETETQVETPVETMFDVVMVFFYLERRIFSEVLKAVRPAGLLVYKTHTSAQTKPAGGPKIAAYLLEPGELLKLADGLHILHYQEEVAEKATAELVARKEPSTEKT
jgi:SAM-dependent methyltransferase